MPSRRFLEDIGADYAAVQSKYAFGVYITKRYILVKIMLNLVAVLSGAVRVILAQLESIRLERMVWSRCWPNKSVARKYKSVGSLCLLMCWRVTI